MNKLINSFLPFTGTSAQTICFCRIIKLLVFALLLILSIF